MDDSYLVPQHFILRRLFPTGRNEFSGLHCNNFLLICVGVTSGQVCPVEDIYASVLKCFKVSNTCKSMINLRITGYPCLPGFKWLKIGFCGMLLCTW
jgi:hypothetical protein